MSKTGQKIDASFTKRTPARVDTFAACIQVFVNFAVTLILYILLISVLLRCRLAEDDDDDITRFSRQGT